MMPGMADRLPHAFRLLAGANLGAQSAEQLSLAAVPLVAVLVLGSGAGDIGLLGAMQTLPSCCCPSRWACWPTGCRAGG